MKEGLTQLHIILVIVAVAIAVLAFPGGPLSTDLLRAPNFYSTGTEEFVDDNGDITINSGGVSSPASVPSPPVNLVTSCTKTDLFEYLGGKGGAPIIQTSSNLVTYDGSVIAFSSNSDSFNYYVADSQINLVFPGPDKLLSTSDDGKPIRIDARPNSYINAIDLYIDKLVWSEDDFKGNQYVRACSPLSSDPSSSCSQPQTIYEGFNAPLTRLSTTDKYVAIGRLDYTNFPNHQYQVLVCDHKKAGCKNPYQTISLDSAGNSKINVAETILDISITQNALYIGTYHYLDTNVVRDRLYIFDFNTGKLNTVFDSINQPNAILNMDAGITSNPQIDALFYHYGTNTRLSYILPEGIPDAIPGRTLVDPYTSINGISRKIDYTFAYIHQVYMNGHWENVMRIISGYKQFIDIPLSKINEQYIHELQLADRNSFTYLKRDNNRYNAPYYVTCN